MEISRVQIGKNGVTENFLETLRGYFNCRSIVKVAVLKSARPEGKEGRDKTQEYSNKILEKFGKNYTSKIIGHTIVLRKWKKAQR